MLSFSKKILIFIASFQIFAPQIMAAVSDQIFIFEWRAPYETKTVIPKELKPFLVPSKTTSLRTFELTWEQYVALDDTIGALKGSRIIRIKPDDSPEEKSHCCSLRTLLCRYFVD